MENVNIILAANISCYRKKSGLTQEELADRLGVTFQAVSKWETAKSAPDISFLPDLADAFGCSIDDLFSRTVTEGRVCLQLPWEDDGVIRGVVCEGRRILKASDDMIHDFNFEIKGDTKLNSIKSECGIIVNGNLNGGCNAGDGIIVQGDLCGGINCGDGVNIGGDHSGGINCGDGVNVGGDCSGDINCGDRVNAGGNIEAEHIKGNVCCYHLKCDHIEGDVTIKKGD